MCRKCSAPDNRYFIKDRLTGLLVCEECGFAVDDYRSSKSYHSGDYIWKLNPAWPVYHTFDQLVRQVLHGDEFRLPPCRLDPRTPSRLFAFVLDLISQHSD